MNLRRAIIFEGPAGSGKTTLMNHFRQSPSVQLSTEPELPEIDRPRAYTGTLGLWHAQLKDHRSAMHMLMTPEDQVSLIDRWVVSQQIYDHIRQGRTELKRDALSYSLTYAMQNIANLWGEHWARMDCSIPPVTLNLMFVFVVSAAIDVRTMRSGPEAEGRKYPYSAEAEVNLYRQACFTVQQMTFEPIIRSNISVHFRVLPLFTSSREQRLTTLRQSAEVFYHDDIHATPELRGIGSVPRPAEVELAAV
jgi:hypothetical protein